MDQTAISWTAIGVGVAAASALASAVSALFSFCSSRTAADVAATSLVLRFREQYGSNRMLFDLRNLRAWHAKYPNEFAQAWAQKVEKKEKEALIIDGARRRVSSFCGAIIDLHDAGLLPRRIKALLTDFDGIDVFYYIVEPLERALGDAMQRSSFTSYDRGRFDRLRNLRPPRTLGEPFPRNWVIREPDGEEARAE